MIIFEAFMFFLLLYMAMGLCAYVYLAIKTYEFTGVWNFKIENGYVGIFKYPKWMFIWLEKLVNTVRKGDKK